MEADWTAKRGWTSAQTLWTLGTTGFRPPRLAVDARGDAVVAWTEQEAGVDRVRAAYWPAGQGWQPAQTISAPGEEADHPQVAVDGRGQALVVWASSQTTLEAALHKRTGNWTKAKAACACNGAFALAMNPRGQAVLVWGNRRGVWSETRSPSGRWSRPRRLSSVEIGPEYIALAINPRGAAVAAWVAAAQNEQLTVAIRPARGRFGPPQVIGGDAYWGWAVALARTGEAVVVWGNHDCCLYAMTRLPGARSFSSRQILDQGRWTAASPAVAMDAHGDALALWVGSDAGGCGCSNARVYVHVAQRPSGGSFERGSDLADIGQDSYKYTACGGEPMLAMTPNGHRAVAVWLAQLNTAPMGTCTSVQAATYSTAEPLVP